MLQYVFLKLLCRIIKNAGIEVHEILGNFLLDCTRTVVEYQCEKGLGVMGRGCGPWLDLSQYRKNARY